MAWKYIVRRLLYFPPVVLAIVILVFFMVRMAPGDPMDLYAGEAADPEYREYARRFFGLDKPIHEQLIIYITNVFQGNLGLSYTYRQPVLTIIMNRIPATVLMVFTGLTIAVVVGISLGVIAAGKPYSIRDNVIMSSSIMAYSLPVFWIAQLLILVFALNLDLFPTIGSKSIGKELQGLEYIADILWHLTLPAIALGMKFLALFARLTRVSVIEAMRQNFILTARAKGVKERDILFKHAFRNGIIPVVTVVGVQFGVMIAGVVLTESVFAWPGIGLLLTDAIFYRDYPVIIGIFLIVAISVVASSLIVDIIYTILDPRIKYK